MHQRNTHLLLIEIISHVKSLTQLFKETKNNEIKIVPIKSKRARGVMTNFIIKEKITNPESLKAFEENGYRFNNSLSSSREYVFVN